MLSIENLHVEISGPPAAKRAGKKILDGVNLDIEKGVTSVMFGQNGSGKTSLVMAIMGFPQYKITKGKIIFKDKVINNLSIDERARLGIGILLQRPPTVRGVKVRQMLEITKRGFHPKFDVEKMASKLNMKEFLDRDLNLGFSGGEMKRSELLQLAAQSPDLLLLDEPESGVDLENIVLIGEVISNILDKNKSALIITHTGHILDYVNATRGCVLENKKIQCVGDPHDILKRIRKYGYKGCIHCHRKEPEKVKEESNKKNA
jgi:Fe-S cluster assembly ATP-binding protein